MRGEEKEQRKDSGAFLSGLPQARPGSSSGPHQLQPARRRDLRSQHPHRGRRRAGRKRKTRPLAWAEKPFSAGSLAAAPRRGSKRRQRPRRDQLPPHPLRVRGHYSRRRGSPRGRREAASKSPGSKGQAGSPPPSPCGAAGAARSVSFRRAGPGSLPSALSPIHSHNRPGLPPPYPGTICGARGGFSPSRGARAATPGRVSRSPGRAVYLTRCRPC